MDVSSDPDDDDDDENGAITLKSKDKDISGSKSEEWNTKHQGVE